jgi:hypothetical protein
MGPFSQYQLTDPPQFSLDIMLKKATKLNEINLSLLTSVTHRYIVAVMLRSRICIGGQFSS